ncbi:MAG TPA: hypothetical protein VMY37_09935 [Thermoguttaceae bacterium]|nr:hypothetical protein [Thermoguttaceae bacterium]HUT89806.1 hypothetical protein [Thermoguttaceae bacterium]
MKTGTDKMLCTLGFKVQGDLGPITCYTSKRDRVVWYIKAPPLEPPSDAQVNQRYQFIWAAEKWREIGQEEHQRWEDIAAKAHLRISGYNLFTYWCLTGDLAAITTACHHAGKSLTLPPPN